MERNQKLKSISQHLRKHQTKEKNLLWYRFLSKYPLRFRRQYTIGNYIVDFYCHKAKLVVELDGSQHYAPEGIVCDQTRTSFLTAQGLLVLRYSNLDVLQKFEDVCEHIDCIVKERASSNSSAHR